MLLFLPLFFSGRDGDGASLRWKLKARTPESLKAGWLAGVKRSKPAGRV